MAFRKSRTPRSKAKSKERKRIDRAYLRALGIRLETLIYDKGFKSPYDFWVEKSDGLFSRATLNCILRGEKDARISTLRILAECLGIAIDELLRFRDPAPSYKSKDDNL